MVVQLWFDILNYVGALLEARYYLFPVIYTIHKMPRGVHFADLHGKTRGK